jgi:3-methyladenine DNA glycosylase AlkD
VRRQSEAATALWIACGRKLRTKPLKKQNAKSVVEINPKRRRRFALPAHSKTAKALTEEIQSRVQALPLGRVADLRAVRREFSKLLKDAHPDLIFEVALNLLGLAGIDYRFIAYELVQHHPATMAGLKRQTLEKLGKGIDSWAAVDCFSCYLAGPAWRNGQIDDRVIRRWTALKDRWWRRAALVATVPLNNKTRGGHGDAARTLAVCRLLLSDRDDMVVKAMSWALRELAKRDSMAVKVFLKEERARLAPRVIREVKNKLATGLKNPKRD